MSTQSVTWIIRSLTGGLARAARLAAETLPPIGIDIHFIVTNENCHESQATVQFLQSLGCRVDFVYMERSIRPVSDWMAYREIRSLLKKHRPDLVHTHAAKGGYLGRKAAKSENIKAVHTAHVFAFEWAKWCRKYAYILLERRAAKWCNKLIVLTSKQEECVLNNKIKAPQHVTMIPNGVDTEYFSPPTFHERDNVRSALEVLDDEPLIGYIGRLTAQKNLPSFVETAIKITAEVPKAKFVIAGSGPLESAFRYALQRFNIYAIFLGSQVDVKSVLSGLDCFVLPSLYEGQPYALMEAMSMGIPSVATKTWGAESLMIDGESGYLCDIGDSESMSKRVIEIITQPQTAKSIGSWARAGMIQNYPLAGWAESLKELYCSLL